MPQAINMIDTAFHFRQNLQAVFIKDLHHGGVRNEYISLKPFGSPLLGQSDKKIENLQLKFDPFLCIHPFLIVMLYILHFRYQIGNFHKVFFALRPVSIR